MESERDGETFLRLPSLSVCPLPSALSLVLSLSVFKAFVVFVLARELRRIFTFRLRRSLIVAEICQAGTAERCLRCVEFLGMDWGCVLAPTLRSNVCKQSIQPPGTSTVAYFAYPYQDLARGVLFRASPEEVGTVVHDAVVVICEVGVGRLRSPLVEVAPFAWNAIEIPVSLLRPCV